MLNKVELSVKSPLNLCCMKNNACFETFREGDYNNLELYKM